MADLGGEPAFGDRSAFWEDLARAHTAQLDELGAPLVKRAQALRYFTWRWRPGALLRSAQLRFLLRSSRPQDWAAALRQRTVRGAEAWAPLDWPAAERALYSIATRLLWRYAQRRGDLDVLALPEPELGAPPPVFLGDRLISQDLANTALEVAAMREVLGDRRPNSIIEIGAGYGRTAYALLSIFPDSRYTIIDIEPALSLSRWYLESLFDADRLTFLTPAQAAEAGEGYDLGLSISSLQEMRPDQVAGYLELLDAAVAGLVYLKQWEEWRNPVDHVTQRFDAYPVPPAWRQALRRSAPVQTAFGEAAWWTRVLAE